MEAKPKLSDLGHAGVTPIEFTGQSFAGINVTNPARPAAFHQCSFTDVRFKAVTGHKATLAGSVFDRCKFKGCHFGPATLDLGRTSFLSCRLDKVQFMLAKLTGADFSGSHLIGVSLRSAELNSASFKAATLDQVCFEKANLSQADFTSCVWRNLDFWGEPPWGDATVSDEVRYSFGIVDEPFSKIDSLLEGGCPGVLRQGLLSLKAWLQEWAEGCPEVMIKHEDVSDMLALEEFVALLKVLKSDT